MREGLDLLLHETAHRVAKGFVLGGVERAGHALAILVKARKMAATLRPNLRRVAGAAPIFRTAARQRLRARPGNSGYGNHAQKSDWQVHSEVGMVRSEAPA
jgi:hypothetical protein